MESKTAIKVFQDIKVRSAWNDEAEKWYFSVIDIVAVLTEQPDHKKAQSYWTTLKNRLKKEGSEIVTKCDKLKLLAADGKNYLTDVADTETVFRLVQSIPSPKAEPFKLWIAQVARERIDEIEDPEIGIERLMETYQKKENLRDNMTNLELVLNMLAEATTTEISKEKKPETFAQSQKIARQGGTIAGNTRKEIEGKTGKKVVSRLNAKNPLPRKNKEIK